MMIFANSPGWMEKEPMVIQMRAPNRAGKNIGRISRISAPIMEM
jgi:hypothetical protein